MLRLLHQQSPIKVKSIFLSRLLEAYRGGRVSWIETSTCREGNPVLQCGEYGQKDVWTCAAVVCVITVQYSVI